MKIGFIGLGHMGTGMAISVALSERLAAAHVEAGQRFVAAPVFGRPEAAATGKLFIAAAGEPDAVEACMPLFKALGQSTVPMPLASLLHDRFVRLLAQGGETMDWSGIAHLATRDAAVAVAVAAGNGA